MLKTAIPDPFMAVALRIVEPSMNVTVPVGIPEPGASAVTVAVKVTDWPNTEGLCEAVTAVEVVSVFTV